MTEPLWMIFNYGLLLIAACAGVQHFEYGYALNQECRRGEHPLGIPFHPGEIIAGIIMVVCLFLGLSGVMQYPFSIRLTAYAVFGFMLVQCSLGLYNWFFHVPDRFKNVRHVLIPLSSAIYCGLTWFVGYR